MGLGVGEGRRGAEVRECQRWDLVGFAAFERGCWGVGIVKLGRYSTVLMQNVF